MNQNAWQELLKMAAALGIVDPPSDNTLEVEGVANGGGNTKAPEPGIPGEVAGEKNSQECHHHGGNRSQVHHHLRGNRILWWWK